MTFITSSDTNIESPLDAYGRLQVSNPLTLFTSKQQSTDDPDQMSTLTVGTGSTSYTPPYPHTNMQVSANGDKVIRQSKLYVPYQPGKTLQYLLTGTLMDDTSIENVRARIGQFDSITEKTVDSQPTGDGFFFEVIGGTPPTINLVYRDSNTSDIPAPTPPTQTDTVVPQDDWNIDKVDGTGPSGYVFDPSKRQIFVFQIAWLGVGDILCGLFNDNRFIPCHRFNFLGTGSGVAYSTRGSLPCRYEIEAIGIPASTATMRQVCCSVSSDAGFTPRGDNYSVSMTSTKSISTTEVPIISLRLNQTGTSFKKVRTILNILKVSLILTANADVIYNIYLFQNPTQFGAGPLTGASFVNQSTDVSIPNSAAEYDISATAVDLTGVTYPFKRFDTGFITKTVSVFIAEDISERTLLLTSDISGNSDLLVITMRTFSGNQSAAASIQWQEFD